VKGKKDLILNRGRSVVHFKAKWKRRFRGRIRRKLLTIERKEKGEVIWAEDTGDRHRGKGKGRAFSCSNGTRSTASGTRIRRKHQA